MAAALARPVAPREERLRTIAGLPRCASIALTAWRGRSGRRYVASIHPLTATEFDDLGPAVVLAVFRDSLGHSRLVDVATTDNLDVLAFMARAVAGFATELHAHRLCDDVTERRALVSDLLTLREAA